MIFLGTARLISGQVNIVPPVGQFGGIEAVRLSNYTNELLRLTNMFADRPGTEYLLPFQTMVYRIENFKQPPIVTGQLLGPAFASDRLLVEWSTQAVDDFPGTYPSAITPADLASVGGAAPSFSVAELAVPNDGTTYAIPEELTRSSLTFFNDSLNAVEWSAADSGWGTNPQIAAGSGRTVNTTAEVFFRAVAGAGSIQWFATGFGL